MFEYRPAPDGSRPGFAIVTGRFVTLFGHDTGAEFAGELYALLQDDASELADVLDLLALDGGPPDCGIVEVVDPDARSVHVAVRGQVDVEMDGVASTRFSGPGGGAWVLGDASGIDGLRLAIGRPAGVGDRLPVQRGVVRTAEIAMAGVRQPSRRPSRDELQTRPIDLPGDGVLLPFSGQAVEVSDPERVTRTQLAPAPAMPRREAGSSVVPMTAELDALALEATVVPGIVATVEPIAAPTPDWVVFLPDGGVVKPPVVFGRRPSALAGEGAVHVVVPSPRREVSARHVQVAVRDGRAVAVDLGSTNGTLVYALDRAPHLLIHNAQVGLETGDILDLGESYLVTVGEAGAARSE